MPQVLEQSLVLVMHTGGGGLDVLGPPHAWERRRDLSGVEIVADALHFPPAHLQDGGRGRVRRDGRGRQAGDAGGDGAHMGKGGGGRGGMPIG